MSTPIHYGTDGRQYYNANDEKLYPYTESSYSNAIQTSTQQYHQVQYVEQRPSYHQYADNTAEAGSFHGGTDPYGDDNFTNASSSTRTGEKETAKYVKKQEREQRHREQLRRGGHSSRRKHEKETKKKIEETLKSFQQK
ncbi:hypothetical protein BDP55DRAFT_625262 [Colletotrichum godetiae]|uniref:Uncharacterized protein n=1 Tax=Colletotrichum godetiae TaxID=1209918 RepID=A0AAJ0B3K2_9PEZI|nr:uncharacterized protein BDP55DRAFT_625262 [Colletotrichum godetiae]KAK1701004.1 hypothetical protein BDP55DRAFT_625262 [Colletotrichum godetiae]